ncbi:ArpD ABC-type protease/lipase transport system, ATPase and permease components [Methylophilaceae bacterium]
MQNPIREILSKFHKEILIIGFFSFLANILMLTPTIYMLQVFDRVMISQSGLTLLAVTLICLLLFGIMGFSEWCRSRLLVRTGIKFDELLNSNVFYASFKAALEKGDANPGQGLSDLMNVRQFLTGNSIVAFFDAPWAPVYILVSWMLHPLLGLISLGFLIAFVCYASLSQWFTRKTHEKYMDISNKTSTFLNSKTRNAEVIFSMGMSNRLFQKWENLYKIQTQLASDIQDKNQKSQSVIKFLQYSQQSIVLGAGAILVIRGELSVGAMIATSILATRALQPIQSIVSTWRSVMAARVSYARLNKLLLEHQEIPALVIPQLIQGKLICENLTALANGRAEPILNNINIIIPPGKILGIMGASGSGKSTLARCLIGIWPMTQGDVKLDDHPIKLLDRQTLGPFIGYLPQEIELFDGSIADNIARLGNVDSNKVIEAAQRVGIHEMILQFPNGYDSPIDIAGNSLSRGQLQRIALARAIYGNPKVLILDEPNASLDNAGETALMNTILDFKQRGTTIVIISHRFGILNTVDLILVLERGNIVTFGEREEVLKKRISGNNPASL